jgi:hypothetical protein
MQLLTPRRSKSLAQGFNLEADSRLALTAHTPPARRAREKTGSGQTKLRSFLEISIGSAAPAAKSKCVIAGTGIAQRSIRRVA